MAMGVERELREPDKNRNGEAIEQRARETDTETETWTALREHGPDTQKQEI